MYLGGRLKESKTTVAAVVLAIAGQFFIPASAQTPPSKSEVAAYSGLHQAAHLGDVAAIRALITDKAKLEARDDAGRTALHVAAFASHEDAVRALAKAGADLNAFENSDYDIVTIAAVANDYDMLDLALSLGASAGNVTSPYEGTALIAAAHLGHHAIVQRLIKSGAPLDHVNNLNWTALIEAVVLGDGGPNHVKTAKALVEAGTDKTIGDRQGVTPLEHARARGYQEMISVLEQ